MTLNYEEAKIAWAARRLGVSPDEIVSVIFDVESEMEYSTFSEYAVPYVEVTIKVKRAVVGKRMYTKTEHVRCDRYGLDELLAEVFEAGGVS